MPQSQVSEVDVLRESVRHNEKSIDILTADFKEFRKEVNGKLERIDERLEAINTNINTKFENINTKFGAVNTNINTKFETINTKFEAINNRFVTLYALIAFSILIPIGIEIFQATKH